MISLISSLSVKLYLNSLVYETSSGLPRKSSAFFGDLRKSSEIFGKFWKMFGNVCVTWQVLENFWKCSETGQKSSENRQNHRDQYVYIIERTWHVGSKIWILCSSGKNTLTWNIVRISQEYLTYPLRSLVRYSCHLNIKFLSSRHPVISSIYF